MKFLNDEVKAFIGCIAPIKYIHPSPFSVLVDQLNSNIGNVDQFYPVTEFWYPPFNYKLEMGENLNTIVFIIKDTILIKDIITIKKYLMSVEKNFSINGRRTFNLNPGFLHFSGMYLATHKNSQIRIYLNNKIWLEKQLDYNGHYFSPMKNTFSEYSLTDRIKNFNSLYKDYFLK